MKQLLFQGRKIEKTKEPRRKRPRINLRSSQNRILLPQPRERVSVGNGEGKEVRCEKFLSKDFDEKSNAS